MCRAVDKAEASYAKQAEDDKVRKWADRIQARAIRRCGELLKQIDPGKGGRPPKNSGETRPSSSLDRWVPGSRREAAESAGMTEHRRKTALRVANVPEPEFTEAVESGDPPTVTPAARSATLRRTTRNRNVVPGG